jgi:hypothetical protein
MEKSKKKQTRENYEEITGDIYAKTEETERENIEQESEEASTRCLFPSIRLSRGN